MTAADKLSNTFISILADVQEVLKPGVQQAERTRMSQTIDRFIELVSSGEEEPGEPPEDTME